MSVAVALNVPATPEVRRTSAVRLGAVLAAMALLVLAVEGWAPRLMDGRSGIMQPGVGAPALDHAPVAVPGRPGVLQVRDAAYRAEFDADGFSYLPTGATAPLEVSLAGVERGGREVALRTGTWSPDGTAARREVAPGVTERVTARDGEVEWDVVLAAPPAGDGDLTIRGRLHGDTGAKVADDHLRVDLAGGGGVQLGETVVLDATGAELHRAVPVVADGAVELRVPDRVLERASYPVTVDPTVTGTAIVADPGSNYWPSIAYQGGANGNYLVVWQRLVGGDYDIYGAIMSGDHSVKTGPFPIRATTKNETIPDVAWNGSSFLVVWELEFGTTDSDIEGQRVSGSGALLGGLIPISTPSSIQRSPAVAAGGSNFLVTWHDTRISGDLEIFGARVDTNGGVIDGGGINISQAANTSDTIPDVAWNGSTFMVTWEEVFVPTNGGPLHAAAIRLVSASGVPGSKNSVGPWDDVSRDPAIASNGDRFLVVWEKTNAAGGSNIRAAHVSSTFLVDFTTVTITAATAAQTDPTVAYNGTYLVAWWDRREGPDFSDIYANRVTGDPQVQDGDGFAIVRSGAEEDHPAVAPGPGSQKWGVAYESGAVGSSAIHLRNASK